jgi:hypothetical protein
MTQVKALVEASRAHEDPPPLERLRFHDGARDAFVTGLYLHLPRATFGSALA